MSPQLPVLRTPSKGASAKDSLQFYLSEVRRYPILSREEEQEYAARYRDTGDREAAERLVTANLRLVIKIAFQYHRQWANVLDLIQEGNVGLVEALFRFDPSREVRFSSYAQYWIRAMILRFLMDNYRMVRLGSTRAGRKLFFQLQKERHRLLEEGFVPTTKALAERLGVSESEVDAVDQHLRAPALSFDGPSGDDEGARPLSEVVPEAQPNSPENNAAQSEWQGTLQDVLHAFADTQLRDEREEILWRERLLAEDPLSLSALGERFGVSKERVRQVEARLKARLRQHLETEMGAEIEFEFMMGGDD